MGCQAGKGCETHQIESGEKVRERQAHAVLDLDSRVLKGRKISALLHLDECRSPLRILDIGAGSGGISAYFANHSGLNCEVTAVDVFDQRQVKEGYSFFLVEGVNLPFPDGSYDVVISNHAIEHVGDRATQLVHLTEMRRVMKTDGIGYLAVPNRWSIIEPHYRLAFLSWLPHGLRSAYLRIRGCGSFYDCEPLSVSDLDALFAAAGFSKNEHLHLAAIHEFIRLEGAKGWLRVLSRIPDSLLRFGRRLNPTLIYTLTK